MLAKEVEVVHTVLKVSVFSVLVVFCLVLIRIGTVELPLIVVVMFALFVGCALYGEPEKVSSTVIHQGFTRDPVLAKEVEVVHTVLKVSVFFLGGCFLHCTPTV